MSKMPHTFEQKCCIIIILPVVDDIHIVGVVVSVVVVFFFGRIVFIQILFVFGFLLLVARLIYLQLFQDVFLDGQVLSRSHLEYSLLAPRGRILDRENNILAFDTVSQ